MKDAEQLYIKRRYPLVESSITRHDCLEYFKEKGLPVPGRSACVFCPFHADKEWAWLKLHSPDDFNKAVAFEGELQSAAAACQNQRGVPYLHRSTTPLAQVKFAEDKQPDLWGNECEGMCGV